MKQSTRSLLRKSLPSRERGLKSTLPALCPVSAAVAPLAGAWIEIHTIKSHSCTNTVAPLAGAWIEICKCQVFLIKNIVAPLAGAWIEIVKGIHVSPYDINVAPLAGAWIEILP